MSKIVVGNPRLKRKDFNRPFDHDPSNYGIAFDETEGRTSQEFAAESDINVIMARYAKTGVVPQYGDRPMFGDYSEMMDYREAMTFVANTNSLFMQLPSAVRARFDNDPGKFCDFAEDEANLPQMREWGLAPAAPPTQAEGEGPIAELDKPAEPAKSPAGGRKAAQAASTPKPDEGGTVGSS